MIRKVPIILVVYAVLVVFAMGFFIGARVANTIRDNDAIQRGYMQHNPTTGKVEWK